MISMCLKCGRVMVGDECQNPECAARSRSAVKAFKLLTYVGGAGMLGTILSTSFLYPTLEHRSTVDTFIFLLMLVPIGVNLVLYREYAKFTRSTSLVAATLLLIFAAVYLLNGALDRHVTTEVQATIASKFVTRGLWGGNTLALTMTWDQKPMEETIRVSSEIFSKAEPGDSVGLIVHPGAFSLPWYGSGRFVNGRDAIRLKPQ